MEQYPSVYVFQAADVASGQWEYQSPFVDCGQWGYQTPAEAVVEESY
jgi:hypothetical protein